MADKYLRRDEVTGVVTETEGTVSGGTNTQAGDLVALDSTGRLDPTILPSGIGSDTYSGTAGEGLAAGDFVYIKSDGTVWKASAAAMGADSVAFVLSSSSTGQPALIYFEGRNTALTGLTPGLRYYLSDSTAGALTATPVVGLGKRHQFLGKAVTSTSLSFEADDSILLAA